MLCPLGGPALWGNLAARQPESRPSPLRGGGDGEEDEAAMSHGSAIQAPDAYLPGRAADPRSSNRNSQNQERHFFRNAALSRGFAALRSVARVIRTLANS